MSEQHGPDLETVLDDYMDAVARPTKEALIEWMKRFPQYAKELAQFTATWMLFEIADGNVDSPQAGAGE